MTFVDNFHYITRLNLVLNYKCNPRHKIILFLYETKIAILINLQQKVQIDVDKFIIESTSSVDRFLSLPKSKWLQIKLKLS